MSEITEIRKYPYDTAVRLGLARGIVRDNKFGTNFAVGTSLATVWDQGGLYPDIEGNEDIYLSSSSAADVGISVRSSSLGSDRKCQWITTVSNGQSAVQLSAEVFKGIQRALVSNDIVPLGDLYFGVDPTPPLGIPADADVRAKIPLNGGPSNGQTRMSRMVVASNNAMIIRNLVYAVGRNDDCEVSLWSRAPGGIWLNKTPIILFQANPVLPLSYRFSPLTEIEVRARSLVSSSKVTATWEYDLYTLSQRVIDALAASISEEM